MSSFTWLLPLPGATPVATSPVTVLSTHLEKAISRLPEQIKNKTNVLGILAALVAPFQELEDVGQDLLLLRGVMTATGATLEIVGSLVGEARNGRSDEDYRRFIRARIFTNRSNGTIPDILQIAELVLFDDDITIRLLKQQMSTIVVRLEDKAVSDALAQILLGFLKTAISVDGRVIIEYSTVAPSATFRFDTGPGFDVGVFANGVE